VQLRFGNVVNRPRRNVINIPLPTTKPDESANNFIVYLEAFVSIDPSIVAAGYSHRLFSSPSR
jgi:hypothetical protein